MNTGGFEVKIITLKLALIIFITAVSLIAGVGAGYIAMRLSAGQWFTLLFASFGSLVCFILCLKIFDRWF